MLRVVIFTCITGNHDSLKVPLLEQRCDLVCFTDGTLDRDVGPWQLRKVSPKRLTARRRARYHKVMSHAVLEGYDVAVWVDGSFEIHGDLVKAAEKYLKGRHVAARHHPWRKPACAYAEGKACAQLHKDDPKVLAAQMKRMRADGYPANNGIVDTGLLFRRHTPEVVAFNERWWDEIERGSCRDQVSFNYAAWKTKGLTVRVVHDAPGRHDNWVRYRGHGNK